MHTDEVETDQRQRHTQPDRFLRFLSYEYAEHRHDDDITGGDKSGLACGGRLHTDLLRDTRCPQTQSTDSPTEQRFCLIVLLFHCFRQRCAEVLLRKCRERQEQNRRDEETRKHEGPRPDIIHADALRDEREAPDDRRQQEQ